MKLRIQQQQLVRQTILISLILLLLSSVSSSSFFGLGVVEAAAHSCAANSNVLVLDGNIDNTLNKERDSLDISDATDCEITIRNIRVTAIIFEQQVQSSNISIDNFQCLTNAANLRGCIIFSQQVQDCGTFHFNNIIADPIVSNAQNTFGFIRHDADVTGVKDTYSITNSHFSFYRPKGSVICGTSGGRVGFFLHVVQKFLNVNNLVVTDNNFTSFIHCETAYSSKAVFIYLNAAAASILGKFVVSRNHFDVNISHSGSAKFISATGGQEFVEFFDTIEVLYNNVTFDIKTSPNAWNDFWKMEAQTKIYSSSISSSSSSSNQQQVEVKFIGNNFQSYIQVGQSNFITCGSFYASATSTNPASSAVTNGVKISIVQNFVNITTTREQGTGARRIKGVYFLESVSSTNNVSEIIYNENNFLFDCRDLSAQSVVGCFMNAIYFENDFSNIDKFQVSDSNFSTSSTCQRTCQSYMIDMKYYQSNPNKLFPTENIKQFSITNCFVKWFVAEVQNKLVSLSGGVIALRRTTQNIPLLLFSNIDVVTEFGDAASVIRDPASQTSLFWSYLFQFSDVKNIGQMIFKDMDVKCIRCAAPQIHFSVVGIIGKVENVFLFRVASVNSDLQMDSTISDFVVQTIIFSKEIFNLTSLQVADNMLKIESGSTILNINNNITSEKGVQWRFINFHDVRWIGGNTNNNNDNENYWLIQKNTAIFFDVTPISSSGSGGDENLSPYLFSHIRMVRFFGDLIGGDFDNNNNFLALKILDNYFSFQGASSSNLATFSLQVNFFVITGIMTNMSVTEFRNTTTFFVTGSRVRTVLATFMFWQQVDNVYRFIISDVKSSLDSTTSKKGLEVAIAYFVNPLKVLHEIVFEKIQVNNWKVESLRGGIEIFIFWFQTISSPHIYFKNGNIFRIFSAKIRDVVGKINWIYVDRDLKDPDSSSSSSPKVRLNISDINNINIVGTSSGEATFRFTLVEIKQKLNSDISVSMKNIFAERIDLQTSQEEDTGQADILFLHFSKTVTNLFYLEICFIQIKEIVLKGGKSKFCLMEASGGIVQQQQQIGVNSPSSSSSSSSPSSSIIHVHDNIVSSAFISAIRSAAGGSTMEDGAAKFMWLKIESKTLTTSSTVGLKNNSKFLIINNFINNVKLVSNIGICYFIGILITGRAEIRDQLLIKNFIVRNLETSSNKQSTKSSLFIIYDGGVTTKSFMIINSGIHFQTSNAKSIQLFGVRIEGGLNLLLKDDDDCENNNNNNNNNEKQFCGVFIQNFLFSNSDLYTTGTTTGSSDPDELVLFSVLGNILVVNETTTTNKNKNNQQLLLPSIFFDNVSHRYHRHQISVNRNVVILVFHSESEILGSFDSFTFQNSYISLLSSFESSQGHVFIRIISFDGGDVSHISNNLNITSCSIEVDGLTLQKGDIQIQILQTDDGSASSKKTISVKNFFVDDNYIIMKNSKTVTAGMLRVTMLQLETVENMERFIVTRGVIDISEVSIYKHTEIRGVHVKHQLLWIPIDVQPDSSSSSETEEIPEHFSLLPEENVKSLFKISDCLFIAKNLDNRCLPNNLLVRGELLYWMSNMKADDYVKTGTDRKMPQLFLLEKNQMFVDEWKCSCECGRIHLYFFAVDVFIGSNFSFSSSNYNKKFRNIILRDITQNVSITTADSAMTSRILSIEVFENLNLLLLQNITTNIIMKIRNRCLSPSGSFLENAVRNEIVDATKMYNIKYFIVRKSHFASDLLSQTGDVRGRMIDMGGDFDADSNNLAFTYMKVSDTVFCTNSQSVYSRATGTVMGFRYNVFAPAMFLVRNLTMNIVTFGDDASTVLIWVQNLASDLAFSKGFIVEDSTMNFSSSGDGALAFANTIFINAQDFSRYVSSSGSRREQQIIIRDSVVTCATHTSVAMGGSSLVYFRTVVEPPSVFISNVSFKATTRSSYDSTSGALAFLKSCAATVVGGGLQIGKRIHTNNFNIQLENSVFEISTNCDAKHLPITADVIELSAPTQLTIGGSTNNNNNNDAIAIKIKNVTLKSGVSTRLFSPTQQEQLSEKEKLNLNEKDIVNRRFTSSFVSMRKSLFLGVPAATTLKDNVNVKIELENNKIQELTHNFCSGFLDSSRSCCFYHSEVTSASLRSATFVNNLCEFDSSSSICSFVVFKKKTISSINNFSFLNNFMKSGFVVQELLLPSTSSSTSSSSSVSVGDNNDLQQSNFKFYCNKWRYSVDRQFRRDFHQTTNSEYLCPRNQLTFSKSLITETSTRSFSKSLPPIAPKPPKSSLRKVASVETATAVFMGLSSVGGAASGALTVGRSRDAMVWVGKIGNQDCGGNSNSNDNNDDGKPHLAEAPMQLKLANLWSVGTFFGNLIMTILISILCVVLFVGIHYYKKNKQKKEEENTNTTTNSTNSRSDRTRRSEQQNQQQQQQQRGGETTKKKSIKQILLESSSGTIILFWFLLLLQPMLQSTVAIAFTSSSSKISIGLKVFVILLQILGIVIFSYILFKLLYVRKFVEVFKITQNNNNNNNAENTGEDNTNENNNESTIFKQIFIIFKKLYEYFLEPEGEFILVHPRKLTKEDQEQFRLTFPLLEPYTARFFSGRFLLIDLAMMLFTTFADILGNAISGSKGCVAGSVVLLLGFSCHFILTVYYRPNVERLLKIAIPVLDFISFLCIIIALFVGSEDAIGVLMMNLASFQLIVSLCTFVATAVALLAPVVKAMLVQSRSNRNQPQQQQQRSSSRNREIEESGRERDSSSSSSYRRREERERERTSSHDNSYSNSRSDSGSSRYNNYREQEQEETRGRMSRRGINYNSNDNYENRFYSPTSTTRTHHRDGDNLLDEELLIRRNHQHHTNSNNNSSRRNFSPYASSSSFSRENNSSRNFSPPSRSSSNSQHSLYDNTSYSRSASNNNNNNNAATTSNDHNQRRSTSSRTSSNNRRSDSRSNNNTNLRDLVSSSPTRRNSTSTTNNTRESNSNTRNRSSSRPRNNERNPTTATNQRSQSKNNRSEHEDLSLLSRTRSRNTTTNTNSNNNDSQRERDPRSSSSSSRNRTSERSRSTTTRDETQHASTSRSTSQQQQNQKREQESRNRSSSSSRRRT